MKVTKRDINGRIEKAESKNLVWIANPRKDIGWEIREKETATLLWEELRGWHGFNSAMKNPQATKYVDEMVAMRRFVREQDTKSA